MLSDTHHRFTTFIYVRKRKEGGKGRKKRGEKGFYFPAISSAFAGTRVRHSFAGRIGKKKEGERGGGGFHFHEFLLRSR